jgi:hypothetical protein
MIAAAIVWSRAILTRWPRSESGAECNDDRYCRFGPPVKRLAPARPGAVAGEPRFPFSGTAPFPMYAPHRWLGRTENLRFRTDKHRSVAIAARTQCGAGRSHGSSRRDSRDCTVRESRANWWCDQLSVFSRSRTRLSRNQRVESRFADHGVDALVLIHKLCDADIAS